MTDDEYIKAAVELADGWVWVDNIEINLRIDGSVHVFMQYEEDALNQHWLDALAAQLVRQADAIDPLYTVTIYEQSTVFSFEAGYERKIGPDRTMNTIKAIVDSGVLSEQDAGS